MHHPSPDPGLISLTEFRQFLFDPLVPLGDLQDFEGKPLAKIFPYWRRHGLLPFVGKGQWLRLSFAQLVWVRTLDTLRQFGYPLEKTKGVCHYFFKDAYNHHLPERNLKENQVALEKKRQAGTITEEEQGFLDRIPEMLSDETLLYGLRFDINYLTNLLTRCLQSGEEAAILIFSDGQVAAFVGEAPLRGDTGRVDRSRPHLRLSLTHLLREFIDSEALSAILLPQLLNDDEKKVLRELRTQNVRELTVVLKGGTVVRMESTQDRMITGEEAKKIREILGLRNYERITLDTRDEKTLSFKKTQKKINP